MLFYLEGISRKKKAAKAAQLSRKILFGFKTLEPTATIHYRVVLNNKPLKLKLIVNGFNYSTTLNLKPSNDKK
jgi:hypothetical protein